MTAVEWVRAEWGIDEPSVHAYFNLIDHDKDGDTSEASVSSPEMHCAVHINIEYERW